MHLREWRVRGTPLNGARSEMGEVETVCAKGCMCVWSILVCVRVWCVWCVNWECGK